jgi:F420H(2)-dependent quinone reductase
MMNDKEFIDQNEQVVKEFRAHGGKVKGWAPLVVLTIKGAKSGQPRPYALMSIPYGDNYLAVASKGGTSGNPQWYYNLVAHPDITLEIGNEKFPATARLLSGEERAKAFEHAITVFTDYAEYQKITERQIPVFVLERNTN